VDRSERVALAESQLEIVVKGRHADVTDRFRTHCAEKLGKLERLDAKAYRLDVEICHEANPRLAGMCDRVELTLRSRGPVVRAEAAAQDMYSALDLATTKLEERMRRAADRRRGRQHALGHGGGPAARMKITADLVPDDLQSVTSANGTSAGPTAPAETPAMTDETVDQAADEPVLLEAGPLVVREKAHDATPMSLDDALHQMELVGHDFYLFCCAETGLPSVVYRRRGYTYGVMRLRAPAETAAAG
jgi:ribosomal subunit interface protein